MLLFPKEVESVFQANPSLNFQQGTSINAQAQVMAKLFREAQDRATGAEKNPMESAANGLSAYRGLLRAQLANSYVCNPTETSTYDPHGFLSSKERDFSFLGHHSDLVNTASVLSEIHNCAVVVWCCPLSEGNLDDILDWSGEFTYFSRHFPSDGTIRRNLCRELMTKLPDGLQVEKERWPSRVNKFEVTADRVLHPGETLIDPATQLVINSAEPNLMSDLQFLNESNAQPNPPLISQSSTSLRPFLPITPLSFITAAPSSMSTPVVTENPTIAPTTKYLEDNRKIQPKGRRKGKGKDVQQGCFRSIEIVTLDSASEEEAQDATYTPTYSRAKKGLMTSNINQSAASPNSAWQKLLENHSEATIDGWRCSLESYAQTPHSEGIIASFLPGIRLPDELCDWALDLIRACRAQ